MAQYLCGGRFGYPHDGSAGAAALEVVGEGETMNDVAYPAEKDNADAV